MQMNWRGINQSMLGSGTVYDMVAFMFDMLHKLLLQ